MEPQTESSKHQELPSPKKPLIDLRAPAQMKLLGGIKFISALPLANHGHFNGAKKEITHNMSMENFPEQTSLFFLSSSAIAPSHTNLTRHNGR
ncbi:hypothetical protein AVEN_156173-1 [Araneus ventricosus]|uniref:Uncharacterized protein n=1 Tax=Araneus ventricosus TaxID=182803 RepID=A0A4Y2W2F4_ARAVE|nr:hypothetical protein AVEN_156173-1 [Araneus ventricosus]